MADASIFYSLFCTSNCWRKFEPQLLRKNQTSVSQDIEEKILSMYAKGMPASDIECHIREIYGIAVSDTTASRMTDKILPMAKEWQRRPLEAVYVAIGINLDGRKDVLSMWVGVNENASFG